MAATYKIESGNTGPFRATVLIPQLSESGEDTDYFLRVGSRKPGLGLRPGLQQAFLKDLAFRLENLKATSDAQLTREAGITSPRSLLRSLVTEARALYYGLVHKLG